MYITKAALTNIGPFYGRHDFEFDRGANVILADNGAGKSTLVDAIYAAITNDFSRFDGVRTDVINNRSTKDDESAIRVTIVHDDATIAIKRSLRPAKYELKVNDEKLITSDKEGTERLRRLGIDKKILDFAVFKRQPGTVDGALDDFLHTTPAIRAKAYMALNGTEHCETVQDVLASVIAKDREAIDQAVDNTDELTHEIGELKDQRDDINLRITLEKEKQLEPTRKENAEEILRRAERQAAALTRLGPLKLESDTLGEELRGVTTNAKKQEKAYEGLKKATDAMAQPATMARSALAAFEQCEKQQARKQKLLERKKLLTVKKEPPFKPKAPPVNAEQKLAAYSQELMEAKKTLALFSQKGMMYCPTCSTEIAAIESHLKHLRGINNDRPGQISELQSLISHWKEYESSLAKYNEWKATNDAAVKENEEALAAIKDLQYPDGDKEELAETIRVYEKNAEVTEGAKKQWEGLTKLVTRKEAQLAAVDSHIRELLTTASENQVLDEVLVKAKIRLKEHRTAELEIANLEGQLVGINTQIAAKKTQYEQAKARMKRSRKLKEMTKVLQLTRDIFHKQALPQAVAQANLTRMEGDVNKGLELFGAPFWVETDTELSFLVHKPGDPPHRAEALSGGQKGVLSVAFWITVNSLYRSGLGMLVLDEPTANLDDENIKFLAQAITYFSKKVKGKQQLIVITHAEGLKAAFDRVIQLKA